VLVEKQHTVADAYPLTLNALVSGCNQKTSRDPVINASDGEVQETLDRLRGLSLVVETSGGRVMRYAHNVGKVLSLPPQSVALLAVLFLRGPQTAGELRIHSERLHRFGDILSVEAFLRELNERPAGALVVELPRAAGARETRWAHLLSGEPENRGQTTFSAPQDGIPAAGNGGLTPVSDVEALRAEIEVLKATVARLCAAVGIDPDEG
jgi:uncharacterized protein YceH (UPF0502 family)